MSLVWCEGWGKEETGEGRHCQLSCVLDLMAEGRVVVSPVSRCVGTWICWPCTSYSPPTVGAGSSKRFH